MEKYALKVTERFAQVVANMLLDKDYQALYELGNRINGEAARRGLPHEEPVALFDPLKLKVEDFE